MSIYVLIDYVESCQKVGLEPNFQELHKWKEKYWRD